MFVCKCCTTYFYNNIMSPTPPKPHPFLTHKGSYQVLNIILLCCFSNSIPIDIHYMQKTFYPINPPKPSNSNTEGSLQNLKRLVHIP